MLCPFNDFFCYSAIFLVCLSNLDEWLNNKNGNLIVGFDLTLHLSTNWKWRVQSKVFLSQLLSARLFVCLQVLWCSDVQVLRCVGCTCVSHSCQVGRCSILILNGLSNSVNCSWFCKEFFVLNICTSQSDYGRCVLLHITQSVLTLVYCSANSIVLTLLNKTSWMNWPCLLNRQTK